MTPVTGKTSQCCKTALDLHLVDHLQSVARFPYDGVYDVTAQRQMSQSYWACIQDS